MEAAMKGAAANTAVVESALTQSTMSAVLASKRVADLAVALIEEHQQMAVLAQRLALSERLVSTRKAKTTDARGGAAAPSQPSPDVKAEYACRRAVLQPQLLALIFGRGNPVSVGGKHR
ncbi:hypothetical protein I4F81_009443 [Pyropia yezoensis]|uniref:Uncharacterized protein n=1 Tax=Pyropia yezoensis TaxID=2788 RepID=A0ACC3CAY6_PYRYE|nr:hypothetical protein I4F81_009443 [Neopyropia yezoensis]